MSEKEKSEEGPKIEPSAEMAEALRDATAAVDARRAAGSTAGDPSTEGFTIEALATELEALKEEFESRCKELAEYTDRYTRLQAEFDNFRRRSIKEKQETLQYGQQNLIKDLLATVDNLERALEHADPDQDTDVGSVLAGVDLVRSELLGALGKNGVKVVDPAGEPFDPNYHEAMGQIPLEDTVPNSVVQVLQKGYVLQDRMLRPARVLVSKQPDGEETGGS
jgi:molecular chaperone GrpE